MRHLLSIVLGLVFAPVIYFATGYGMLKWIEATGSRDPARDTEAIGLSLAGFGVAGLLYTLLLLLRLSPLGPALAGAAFLGLGLWAPLDPVAVSDLLDFELLNEPGVTKAAMPLLPMLAIPLLATLFVINRWRAKAPAAALAPDGDYQSDAGYQPDGGYQPDPGYQQRPYPTAPYPSVQQPGPPSAYSQQYGTHGSGYGSPYTSPEQTPPTEPQRDETPATTVMTPPANSWPPPDNHPTLPNTPPSAPSSGQPGTNWPQPPSAPSWSQPPPGQSWSSTPPEENPVWNPPTERIEPDRPWGESPPR